jgi:hypothetical protein
MRRTAQSSIMRGRVEAVTKQEAEALDDMLCNGGRLNIRLLGGAEAEPSFGATGRWFG